MPVSKAQQRAVKKYSAAHYDRLEILLPKGRRETIRRAAAGRGLSVNGYVAALVCADLHLSSEEWKARPEEDADGDQGDG